MGYHLLFCHYTFYRIGDKAIGNLLGILDISVGAVCGRPSGSNEEPNINITVEAF